MKRFLSALGFILILPNAIKAQDPHFSQFFSSPLTLNPALTGKFDGTLRVAGNYRNQWPAFNNVYTTSTLSVDFHLLKNKLPDFDTWGLGILALKDQAGGNILTNNYLGISTSYHKALDENGFQQIGIGFQGTYGQKRLDISKLYYADMLTPFGFTGLTQEIYQNDNLNLNYLDLNAGLLFSSSTNDQNNFYVGASMYHINRPRESFQGGSWSVSPRTTLSAGGYFPLSDIITLHTSGIYQVQNKATEMVVGGALAAALDVESENPSNVFIGSWYRLNDAIIPYIGLEFAGLRIGATYDINTSSLKSGSQSRGGMEISLIYIKRPAGYKGIPCPKF
ncbi:MAG: PorP/SprF family type IX secretion system membrane protein [Bacteroidetes bacterium]|nr:PorP/SprF family type IX secretion system membrane protein [Bacteroidota bacterium]